MGTLSQKSVLLDGSNEHILIGNVAALDFDRLSPFSISAWVALTGTSGTYAIFTKVQPATVWRGWTFFLQSNRLYVQHINDWGAGNRLEVFTTDIVVTTGPWHHVVLTMDGTGTAAGVKFYVNGTEITSKTTTYDALSATTVGTGSATIGRRNGGGDLHWPGLIDEVAAYSKALSGAEVTTILNGFDPPNLTVTGPTANLVGYWKVGDGDTYPTATDSSSSGNNGTFTNTETTDIVPFGGGVQPLTSMGYTYGLTGAGNLTTAPSLAQTVPFPVAAGAVATFKMRALADPGPGYVTWVVSNTPDFAGTYAPSAIQAGTAVVADTWSA